MPRMKLSDTSLSGCDREWAERVLRNDEELLLVLRPNPKPSVHQLLGGLLFLCGPLFCLALNDGQTGMESVPVLIIFMLAGLAMLIHIPWKHRQEKRSIYLVTNQRMVYLFRSGLGKTETDVSYELRPNVQLDAEEERKDGTGFIAFNYEDEEEALEYGGLLENVPQVRHVVAVLQAALKEQQS